VLERVNLQIASGEFFSILGPSGCGKTTLLRIIAGFEQPTEGRILLDGQDVTSVSPRTRGVGMVFQNYALFPHMTVAGNVQFGLRHKGATTSEIRQKVGKILEAVHMENRADAPVPLLSGGEQQRVAVARAAVVEPGVLLFDEPLSNLDPALRASTREEIKTLQRRTGITSIYVTHDQAEALSLSDRLAVLHDGTVEQVGSPQEVYDRPSSPFVAGFLGNATLLRGEIDARSRQLRLGNLVVPLPSGFLPPHTGPVVVAVKPENVVPVREASSLNPLVRSVEYQGFTTSLLLNLEGQDIRSICVTSTLEVAPRPGQSVPIRIDWDRCSFFPKK